MQSSPKVPPGDFSRRRFLQGGSVAAAGAVAAPAWLPRVALGSAAGDRDVLVNVFLWGGLDGLTAVPPFREVELYRARPTIAIPPPGYPNGALNLDGFFGLAPAAAPLLTPFRAGHLAIVHACGSPDPTRSHFDARALWERGIANRSQVFRDGGWLARHLKSVLPAANAPLRGAVLNELVPDSLLLAPATLPIADPDRFEFPGAAASAPLRRQALENMYAVAAEPLGPAALDTLDTIDLLESIDFRNYQPSHGASYPSSGFGSAMRNAAALIKARAGVEVVSVDYGNWDLHSQQGPFDGAMASLLADFARTMEAFYLDMLGQQDELVTVVQSEFGRRVAENSSQGTDHGRGGCMFVMGGNVNGGQVFAQWPGLDPSSLDDGDLPVTIDFRDVLAEVLAVRLQSSRLDLVFPGHTPTFHGIVS